jgi:hypothetical protein
MPDLTPRLGIKKPLATENVTRASFNENWDIIDSVVETPAGAQAKVNTHENKKDNPHGVTTEQVNHLAENGKYNSDLLTTYPKGVSIFRTTTAGRGFPGQWGTVTTFRGADYGYQYFAQAGIVNTLHFRVYDLANNTWNNWVVTETTAGAQAKADKAKTDAETAAINWAKGFGLGDIAKVVTGTDLNALDATGFYKGNTLTNAPDSGNFFIINLKDSATYKTQIAVKYAVTGVLYYVRHNNNGTWTAWDQLETTTGAQAKVDNALTPSWVTLVLQNGVTGMTGRTPRYTKIGYEVIIEGELNSGIAVGTTIATLPSGYRPITTKFFKVALNTTTSNDGATIYIDSNGNVVLFATPSTGYTTSLIGLRFFLN